MNDFIHNRGPDDVGTYFDDSISMGNRRLAIIDLSIKGHQPMSNEKETIWITYNGEIYNYIELKNILISKGHIFKSNSDTEVIIHAYEEYGFDFVKYFNGMWAFCIYDKEKKILVLSRDYFGIKPLYYYSDKNKFIFSSMIGSILLHQINYKPNEKKILEFLVHSLEDIDDSTFFENIFKVPTDNLLIYHLQQKNLEYYKWYERNKESIYSDPQQIKDLFMDSVKLRTISDVPIGCCLSGGIDSSIITSLLDKYLNQEIWSFTFSIPNSKYDESKYITEIEKYIKIKKHIITMNSNDFINDFNDFILTQEEPVTGLTVYAQYLVMKLAHSNNIKVLLDGQGGDELFAGYPYYFCYYYYELLKEFKLLTFLKESLLYIKNYKNILPFKMLFFMFLPEKVKKYSYTKRIPWFNADLLDEYDVKNSRWNKMTLKDALFQSLYKTEIPHLLKWEDKNSMRWSIESRPPYLDPRLVNFSLNIPSNLKIRNGETKYVIKNLFKEYLPTMILNRKDKIGFVAPADELFREPNVVNFVKKIFNSDSFKNRKYWNYHIIQKIFDDHIVGKVNAGDLIFKIITLELWLVTYFP